LLVPGEPGGPDLVWGGLAGLAGFAGIALLYRALSAGAMAVVAPVTAVTAASVPLVVGLVVDSSPGVVPLAGIGCALVAIGLVSAGRREPGSVVTTSLLGLALLAGLLLGAFTSLLGQTSEAGGMWPLVSMRAVSIGLGLLVAWRAGASLRVVRGRGRALSGLIVGAGVFDVTANAFLVAAMARGHLSVVAAIASLYPVTTVLLALSIDRERLRALQVAGLGLAVAALVLTTA
jgi:uncharacterized membrane protein